MTIELLVYAARISAILFLVGAAIGCERAIGRFFNLSVAFHFAAGAYLWSIADKVTDRGMLPLFAVGCAVCIGITAVILDAVVFSPLRERNYSPDALMIASIAIWICGSNFLALAFGTDTRILAIAAAWRAPAAWGLSILAVAMLFIWIVIAGFIHIVFHSSTIGAQYRAISCDPELALQCGINVRAVRGSVVVGSAVLAGLGGALSASDASVFPGIGLDAAVSGIAVSMLAPGLSPGRLSLAALLLGGAYALTGYHIGSEWQGAVALVAIFACDRARLYVRRTNWTTSFT